MHYDYRAGKKRIDEILDSGMAVIEKNRLPKNDELTFDNSYLSWISAIFIDIRESTELMARDDQEYVAKIVRCFTSELIEILRGEDNLREIGIRGDCVYAVYTTPKKRDIDNVFDLAVWCNTYLNMLNAVLRKRGLDTLRAGIGLGVGHDHVIKAGRKGVDINAHVWMGDAVSTASKLSGYGQKDHRQRIWMSSLFYNNIIDIEVERNSEAKSWFSKSSGEPHGCYQCNVVKTLMNDWINGGMD
ncbi:adenylate cyclase [Ellagibacter isourolithinifaciens]|uniref:Adenylate cyclase n=1 Tax=Ellagibacter isourolithinifaciens TaxID=2137581 RepID=A0A6N6NL57_9ACTN|nr:adenylate/guanylate cyclase domain-containing protein [Ellagibacter isourolithinifaciens]KAB1636147.1 adenylate cyclase [Ellagibacter isourolithinifaciens]